MITLRQNKDDIATILYPDNQPQIKLIRFLNEGDTVRVVWPICSSLNLLQLLLISDALDRKFVEKYELVIPYLLGARSDRLMNENEAVPLKVIANLINSCNFQKVKIFDPHSDVSTALINNSIAISNYELIMRYNKDNALVICPDTGAAKKVSKYFEWNKNLQFLTYCDKHRDLQTGKVDLKVFNVAAAKNRNCVIIDDLCDGGATFLAIAKQIDPAHLTLIVSHGIFSKGFGELTKYFDHIITSDSYPITGDIPNKLTIIPVNYKL